MDRATFLPMGSYEDGTPTLAWPGFVKDTFEGAMRTYLDAAKIPVPDRPPGTKWSSGIDAINAAGLVPIGSIGLRGAKAVKEGAKTLSDVLLNSKNANIFDPPPRTQRAFGEDYKGGAKADETGRLTHDIDGVPLSAKYVAGRREAGGGDIGLGPSEIDDILRELGIGVKQVPSRTIAGDVGRYRRTYERGGVDPLRYVLLKNTLNDEARSRVLAHETGHAIDDFAAGRFGIPTDLLSNELPPLYDTLNNPNRSHDKLEAASWGRRARPQDFGYKGADIPAEHMAEAIRAYLTNPNYIKTEAPDTAARIREWVNTNPRLNKTIQFNSDAGLPALLGGSAQPSMGLLDPDSADDKPFRGLLFP